MIKAALFDFDGTLCDTEDQYSVFWGEMGRRYHPEIPHFEHIIKGTTLKQILERYFPLEDQREELVPQLDAWEAQMDYTFYPGALEFIGDLRKHGVKCAVVTSSNRDKMDKIRRSIPNLDELFDHIFTAEDFSASKPDPDCFLCGQKYYGVSKEECVVFEDAFTGLAAGMASGMFTFGMATTNPREAILDKCNFVLDSMENMNYDKLCDIIRKTSVFG